MKMADQRLCLEIVPMYSTWAIFPRKDWLYTSRIWDVILGYCRGFNPQGSTTGDVQCTVRSAPRQEHSVRYAMMERVQLGRIHRTWR